MSSEPIQTIYTSTSQNIKDKKLTHRVDINTLMSKVRFEEKKKKKENIVFLGLVSSVVIITGVIASL